MQATRLALLVIAELHLPPDARLLKPVDVGGIAGGVKFRHGYVDVLNATRSCVVEAVCVGVLGVPRNVLLKLALDEVGLYGGHDNAGKAAAHDLKGALQVEYAAIPTLCAPLQVLVDYMGFR